MSVCVCGGGGELGGRTCLHTIACTVRAYQTWLRRSSIKRRWSHCIYVLSMQMSANVVMNGCENLKIHCVFVDILVCPQL